MLTRRQLSKLGVAAAVTAVATATGAANHPSPKGPFSVPLPVPSVLRPELRTATHDIYRLVMREAHTRIASGGDTRIRGFNGAFPGPTIRAKRGRPVIVQQVNRLDTPVAVHLHGGHVPQPSDGHPMDLIMPGASRAYLYPNDQPGATLWYHDHAHMLEAENVYRGLAGCYILTDEAEERLPLPKGRYDIPLLLRDAALAADGSLVYDVHDIGKRSTTMVNGRATPYLRVAARKYRFRLVNVSNDRPFALKLGDGSPIVQIASDGGLLPAPVTVDNVVVWPAERAEIVVDFSRHRPGESVTLDNLAAYPGENPQVMRFDVDRTAVDHSRVPDRLRPLPALRTPTVEREFVMTTDMAHDRYLINGRPFDMDRVDFRVKAGAEERWTITVPEDTYAMPHTFHTHLAQFRVVDRNGKPPAPEESGLKDTVAVLPGERVRVQLRFTSYTGRYLYHCHMMGHSAMGMMGQFEVVR
ncbi:multicopper oxidase domain-containing protein [Streptomyces sp. NPDC023838]|uniref:multicopper oxidase family protein n=1 Tax=Streptomyces sp. NPDC023838 TaxID=3154325 RepID=UPI003402F572